MCSRLHLSVRRGPLRELLVLVLSLVALPAIGEEIQWVRAYDAGMRLALEQDRPVVVEFWAKWCKPCRKMDQEVLTDPRIVEASRQFVFIHVDLDVGRAPVELHDVRVVPTVMVLDPAGNVLARRAEFTPADKLLEMLDGIPRSFAPVASQLRRLAADPEDFDALVEIAGFYADAGLVERGAGLYRRAIESPHSAEDRGARGRAQLALGRLLLRAGDGKQARKLFERAVRDCDPELESHLLLGLARSHVATGNAKKGREIFERIVVRFPHTEPANLAAESLARSP